jgi:uridine kinase
MAHPCLIAIAGASGSGKTTLAGRAAAALPGSAVLPLDAYYRDRPLASAAELEAVNYDEPAAIDTALLQTHLLQLRAGRAIERPTYDFRTHRRAQVTRTVQADGYLIVEGLLALYWPALRALYHAAVFIRIDETAALARRTERDTRLRARSPESVRRQWETTVWPMYCRYVEPTRRYADVILDGAAPLDASLATLLGHLRARTRSPRRVWRR